MIYLSDKIKYNNNEIFDLFFSAIANDYEL
jgi:hypothetical protein